MQALYKLDINFLIMLISERSLIICCVDKEASLVGGIDALFFKAL